MNLETKKVFNVFAKKFKNGDYDLGTVSQLVDEIMRNTRNLKANEVKKLIEVPISIAIQDIYYKSDSEWVDKIEPNHRQYFRNKAAILKDKNDFFKGYYELDRYEITDFIDVANYFKDNFDMLMNENDCGLYRQILNPLVVTIRDYCEVTDKDSFRLNGDLFAKQIEDAINLN